MSVFPRDAPGIRTCGLAVIAFLLAIGCSDDSSEPGSEFTATDSTTEGTPSTPGETGDPDGVGGFNEDSDSGEGEDGDSFVVPDGAGGEDGQYCQPNVTVCLGPTTLGTCDAAGSEFVPSDCGEGTGCLGGECVPYICTPGEAQGECANSTEYSVCAESGVEYDSVPCDGALTCYLGECVDFVCVPDSSICAAPGAFKVCLPDGSGFGETQLCPEGELCDDSTGTCEDACAANVKQNVYVGCDYYAIDLANIDGGQDEPLAIVVSTPASEAAPAEITIVDSASGTTYTAAQLQAVDQNLQPSETMLVDPGQLKVFSLPTTGPQGANPLYGSTKAMASYHITSDRPVTVHQFNPLNGDAVFTNDASLLLPTNLGGTEYFVMGWPHRELDADSGPTMLRGFVSVVATEPGTTSIDVHARSPIGGGAGVPFIDADEDYTFVLSEGEVLNLASAGATGSDLTGTWIRATQKVSVFSGHECANIPVSVSYCDHVEQQLIPLEGWGTTYVADSFAERNDQQFDLWRIVAGKDDVLVTTNPPIPGFEAFTLHRGAWVEFPAKGSFVIEGSGPILVGHYMVGSNYPGFEPVCTAGAIPSGIGDPALTLAIPTQQFLPAYVVLTPPGYAENYLNITGPTGVQVTLDGAPVTAEFVPVGETGFVTAKVPVSAGVHNLESTAGTIGVTAYGYDCDVSYAYPGGFQLGGLQ